MPDIDETLRHLKEITTVTKADLVGGHVPASQLGSGASTSYFLRGDGTWVSVPGGGDMTKATYDPASTGKIAEAQLTLNYATHSNANDPTAGQKSAMAGTSGTPGSTNAFVTDGDARNTNARTPISHDNTCHSAAYITGNQSITLTGAVTGTGATSIATSVGVIPGRFLQASVLTASTGTFSVGSSTGILYIRAVAAGGGGGGSSASTSGAAGGAGGGGGGSYGELWIATPTSSYAYVVGRGGGGGLGSTSATGTAGGSTSFGATPSLGCNGGTGGTGAVMGAVASAVAGGAGGAVSINGNVNVGGGAGEEGTTLSATVAFSGAGGNSLLGGGAPGVITNTTGKAAATYGAGGSGGRSNSTGAQAGGAGSNGVIIVWEFD